MQDNFSKNIMLYIALLVPVIGLALRIAPFIDEGLYAFILKFPEAMEHPFKITWCESSLKSILILMILYVMGIGIFMPRKRITAGARSTGREVGRRPEHQPKIPGETL